MNCPICGASCKCKRRGADGMCCSCHSHKVRRIIRRTWGPELGVTQEAFVASMAKHRVVEEPKTLFEEELDQNAI